MEIIVLGMTAPEPLLRERILSFLEAADTYADHLREERLKVRPDAMAERRLAQDAAAGRKSAEVIAQVRIGDALERIAACLEHDLERMVDVLDIPCRVQAPEEFTGSGSPR